MEELNGVKTSFCEEHQIVEEEYDAMMALHKFYTLEGQENSMDRWM